MGGYSWEDSREVSPERYLSTVLAPGRPLVKQREGSALLGCMISVLCLTEREAAQGQEGEWWLCEAADNVDRYHDFCLEVLQHCGLPAHSFVGREGHMELYLLLLSFVFVLEKDLVEADPWVMLK